MPRFYMDELVCGLNTGVFHPGALMNPVFEFRFVPGDIHSMGLWSQDLSVWMKRRDEIRPDYKFWYRVTILPDDRTIKPAAPSVHEQIKQVSSLARSDGPDTISVCIDPVLRYRHTGTEKWTDPFTSDFIKTVFDGLASCRISHVRISFIDYYRKVEMRAERAGIEFYYPGHSRDDGWFMEKALEIRSMADRYSLELESCCEGELANAGITSRGACVNGSRLVRLFGPGLSLSPDTGQRHKMGCGCTRSLDIGRYTETGPMSHKCPHNCPQCYARRGLTV